MSYSPGARFTKPAVLLLKISSVQGIMIVKYVAVKLYLKNYDLVVKNFYKK